MKWRLTFHAMDDRSVIQTLTLKAPSYRHAIRGAQALLAADHAWILDEYEEVNDDV